MKQFLKQFFLFIIGGIIYGMIEIAFRGINSTRIARRMLIVGGLCFTEIGLFNEYPRFRPNLLTQAVLGMITITTLEFISGVVINIILGWNVWDYSGLPLNILGQICLPFCFAWLGLSVVAIFIDDGLRYLIFKEPLPKYKIF